MADFEVKINAEAIEKQVTSAILESALGKFIADSVTSSLKSFKESEYRWNDPFKAMVENEVKKLIAQLVRDETDQIRESVKKRLTPEFIEKLTDGVIEQVKKQAFSI